MIDRIRFFIGSSCIMISDVEIAIKDYMVIKGENQVFWQKKGLPHMIREANVVFIWQKSYQ